MSWRDFLVQHWEKDGTQMASFRDAKFFINNTNTNFGRRNIVHQYPLKEVPYIEDIGSDIEEFTIEGYIVQNGKLPEDDPKYLNYFYDRDALIDALRKEFKTFLRVFC